MFTALLLAVMAPVALAGLATAYGSLLGVSLLLGLAGASFAVGVGFVTPWFPPARRGFALGVYGVGNAGTALAGLLAPRVGRAPAGPGPSGPSCPPLP